MKKLLLLTITSAFLVCGLGSTTQLVQAETGNNMTVKKVSKNQYDTYMRAGYTAYDKKDYNTALINFKQALKIRANNIYAIKAIQNTEKRLSGK